MARHDGRAENQLRAIQVRRNFTRHTPGSVLIECGNTMILCTASLERTLPPWRQPRSENDPIRGWVTAEYNMLPGSTSPRKQRDRKSVDGRTTEIQRLIGRSLRAVVDFEALGANTITIDCDVLQADGGTRTTSITGGFIALCDAVSQISSDRPILKDSVTAISVGVVDGVPVLDLDYHEDSQAEVDMNVVMTGAGRFIEVQGTAEGEPFDQELLMKQLALAQHGIRQLTAIQKGTLGNNWPL
ncbi:MAG: ribonuclease PH [Planctomycetaceae bacterium]|nr:ribonuclease PH [Planctomycetaceae bacterium]